MITLEGWEGFWRYQRPWELKIFG